MTVVRREHEPLLAAAQRLAAAAHEHERNETPATADEVTAARLALQEVFIAGGWVPPPSQRGQMRRDRVLLRQPLGALAPPADCCADVPPPQPRVS